MIPWHHLIATAGLTACLVGTLASTRADDRPEFPPGKTPPRKIDQYPPNATDAEKLEIDLVRFRKGDTAMRNKLLAAYPFESLQDRLKFDVPGRKHLAKSLPTASLDLDKWKPFYPAEQAKTPPASLAALLVEERVNREQYFDRMRALATLHELEVRKFVTNPGFGFARLLARGFNQVPEQPPTDWSEGDRGEAVTLPKAGNFFADSQDKKGPTLPSVFALSLFHSTTAHEFARPDSWGLVKDKKQVAGFQPHTLGYLPEGYARQRLDLKNPIKDQAGKVTSYPVVERWVIRKVELIGLLTHESPVVYLNPDKKLPTMAAVKDAKTRELTEFELSGLKDLAAAKDAVILDAATNQVRMVGAIRMAGACMKCHEGDRGDLLGAFTYDLVRVPAFVPARE